ncbi:hypothetical protein JCM10450v2_000928 [Rhodotorula kratochvilovae]
MLLPILIAPSVSSSLAASGTSSSPTSATSAAPSTPATGVKTTIQLPPLYTCEYATWTYTAPEGPKYLGLYLSGQSDFIETYPLPSVYDSRTNGTFTWRCDLPAGASVAAMFYVLQDGASGTGGNQASTPDAVINAGSTTDCLGANDQSYQAGILSIASSLDPSFSYTADPSSSSGASSGNSSGGGGGDGTPIGAIVGGVVGGVVGIALVGGLLIYLRHKHNQAALNHSDGLSVYSGTTEKRERESLHHSHYTGGPGSTAGIVPPPPGTYYATDAQGNVHLLMGYPGEGGEQPYVPPATDASVLEMPTSPAPRQTAPVGTLPEPMDESSTAPRPSPPVSAPPPGSSVGAPSTPVRSPAPASSDVGHNFSPISERDTFMAHHGLDDPSSFSPVRNQHRSP